MKKMQNIYLMPSLFLTCLLWFGISGQSMAATDTGEPLLSVEDLGLDPDLEAITKDNPSLIGDTQKSLSSIHFGNDTTAENIFLLRAQKTLVLKFYAVGDYTAQGQPIPGELLAEHLLQQGDAYLFRHLVPEGMPNMVICAQDEISKKCWIPRFSGLDGTLELDPGFVLFNENQLIGSSSKKDACE